MIDTYRGSFEYDWRARFHLPLSEVGESMSWGEALRLTELLATDPSAQLGAKMAGWERSASWTELVLMDLFDLQHRAAGAKKPKPYPRPFGGKKRTGPDATLTQADIIAALRKAGHTAALPEDIERR